MTELNPDVLWDCSHEQYHADRDHWGHGMLEVMRLSSTRAHHLYVARDGEKPTTPALDFGGALHCLCLEGWSVFEQRYAICPKGLGMTATGAQSRGTKEWKAWASEHEGKTLIKSEDGETLTRMVEAVMAHPELGAALRRQHETEVGLRWLDDEFGVPLKCRPDAFWLADGIVVDLKGFGRAESFDTVSLRPSELGRRLASLGYHRQEAHYRGGYRALTGEDPRLFLFGMVSRQRPHEVVVVRLDEDAVAVGAAERAQDYRRLAAMMGRAETDGAAAWREPHTRGVHTVSLPKWALQMEDSL